MKKKTYLESVSDFGNDRVSRSGAAFGSGDDYIEELARAKTFALE